MKTLNRKIFHIGALTTLLVAAATLAWAQNFANTIPTGDTLAADESVNDPFWVEPIGVDTPTTAGQIAEQVGDDDAVEIPDFVSEMSHYTLGKTDVIEVEVLRHPEVSGQYVVNNEGNIQYEFVGDIKVEGMTKDQIKDALIERLAKFIISPEVTVKIVGYNSKIVYVIGEVGRPGKIFMRGDTITVREALLEAGLPLLSAKTKKSKLFTPSAAGKPEQRNVDVYRLLYEGDLRENLVMNPGDTLYVPPTLLTKAMRAIQPVAAPIGTAAGTGRTVMTGF